MSGSAIDAEDRRRDVWLIALIAIALVLLVRAGGWFQSVELALLDARIKLAQAGSARHVSLVLESEDDIQRHGHPLPDAVLVQVIERVLQAGANLVVIDKFRDLPVAPGTEALDSLLRSEERIAWVTRFGVTQGRGVSAPAALRDTDRTGCADLQPDPDGVNRRALLAQEDAGESCLSLALAAAAHQLSAEKKEVQFIGANHLQLGLSTLERVSSGDGFQSHKDLSGFQIALAHPVQDVPAYPMRQILDGPLPSLKGQVVFFGTRAQSLGDRHLVPESRGSDERHIPGVAIHARITEELLRMANGESSPVRVPSVLWLLASLLVLAVVGAWAGLLSASLQRGLFGALVVLVLFGAIVLWLDRAHWRFELMAPALACAAAQTMGWARRAQIEKRDRAQLRELFSRQVAPEVAEAIWNDRAAFFREGRVLPVEVRVTVLFADLRGFTSVTEQLDRDKMVTWLNGAVEQMTESVMEQGGVVTRFGGDQVMAVFGVPVPRTDEAALCRDAVNALRAALRMGERLAALNERNAAQGLPAARVRIGVQSGKALQCGVGSRDRFEFTVLGDAVNTASRLESLAGEDDGAPARIFAGGDTIALCGSHFTQEHVAQLKLKGKDIPVDVYRIRGEAA